MSKHKEALVFARNVHKGQRYGTIPYFLHVLEVKAIAEKHSAPSEVLIACILHDTIEDTDTTYNDIKKIFGMEVAEIVYAVTDELGKNRKERKRKTYPKIRKDIRAVIVKLCDRIANVRHSKTGTHGHYSMYARENEEFLKSIVREAHLRNKVVKGLVKELNELFELK